MPEPTVHPALPPVWEGQAPPPEHEAHLVDEEKARQQAEERTTISARVVYEAIRREGADELLRSTSALAWSAVAAGLSMGMSFVTEGLLYALLPEAPWRPLIARFGYCFGFLIVVLGRQQLFSENTLTVILPLLRDRKLSILRNVGRLWAAVLAGNLVGAFLFALAVVHTGVFDPPVHQALNAVGTAGVGPDFVTMTVRGIFAGWLIALMVWLLPSAESGRIAVVMLLTYLVALGNFPHIVAGAVEVFYLAQSGFISWSTCFGGYLLPTLCGNVIGGVALVAILNHAQVVAGGDESDQL